tara:strand:+ start:901 stop:1890 length:990 start_codon:yes stop_codon:yes gene_type:complete
MQLLNHKLYIEPIDAYIDPLSPVKTAIVTHGHADHARGGNDHVIATADTIEIMKRRYGENCAKKFTVLDYGEELKIKDVAISLHPAGHVLGSAQVLLQWRGQRAVMTGDFKTVPDSTCTPFEVVPCDLFVTEATFGLPVFQHPHPKHEIEKLLHSVKSQPERSHLVGAYALGKAQRVIKLLREAGYEKPIYVHGSYKKLCDYYKSRGIDLGDLKSPAHMDKETFRGEIIMGPPSALKAQWARRFPDPVVCFASGWMHIKQRAKQSGVELPLVISDHADWNELTETIHATGAQTIWVTHGREEALVHYCRSQGLNAEPLYLQGREDEDEG